VYYGNMFFFILMKHEGRVSVFFTDCKKAGRSFTPECKNERSGRPILIKFGIKWVCVCVAEIRDAERSGCSNTIKLRVVTSRCY